MEPSVADISGEPVVLHGDLELHIAAARRLPNMDMLSEHLRRCFVPCGAAIQSFRRPSSTEDGGRHHHHHRIITSDPYVTVGVGGATVARTTVIHNSQEPEWDARFKIPLAHSSSSVEFRVKDDDMFGAELIGSVRISAARVASGEPIAGWFDIIGPGNVPPKTGCALQISMQFFPAELDPVWERGVAGDQKHRGVTDTYFPLRKGCSVTLYQDAHVRDDELPEIELEGGRIFGHEKCWEDICHAVLEAHHLIYIVGWSIYTEVTLVREPTRLIPAAGKLTLGELLKYKSEEGVRVCLLVWDDKTSHNKFSISTAGVMQTHDEETRKFFKHSSVICVLSPRYASSKLSIVKQQIVGTLFTHHQKCLLVDTQASGNNRKITAFLGGLDLCDGRYDSPEHRLFSDLDTVFLNDFHNPTFSASTKGPRQPWHDLHCKIEGPAAYDVLKNFEQRWKMATRWREFGKRFKRVSRWSDDALIKLERVSWIISPSPPSVTEDDPILQVAREKDSEAWHVQIFRSIDSGSAKGFPKTAREAAAENLGCEKKLAIDSSIHKAYVKAIRSAKKFIYIENQYFLGSSYGWPSYKNSGANNLVPMELALKIVSKIKARERFAVYVIIPMWPEGDPTSASVQEILYWQGQTMQMMYEIIGKEIKSMKLENAHPQDYLNFYCLGKREELVTKGILPANASSDRSSMAPAQKYRRFMIYVHAKGMIIDDEYVILGSANINQRSLDGSRDTEIAMGAYQPHYSWSEKRKHPHGQVYGYRMSLWAEHLGGLDPLYKDPNSLDCVKSVNKIAEDNWARFTAEDMTCLTGHLLKYPVKVGRGGEVEPLPDYACFPDVGGKILGAATSLPDALTM